jgi:predicted branched-subunit amino acid permease
MRNQFLSLRLNEPAWRDAFTQGCRDITGPALGTMAMGLVAGVAMAKSGVGLGVILAMSLLVFASTSQLACLPLIAAGAPLWLIAATACVLNLRFIVYSANWRPYFGGHGRSHRVLLCYLAGDPIYAQFVHRHPVPSTTGRTTASQKGYFLGLALTNWAIWQVASLAGIFLADAIPASWGLSFVGVLALLALALPMLADWAVRCSALAAGAVAVATASWPMGLNVVAAIAAAMVTGLWADRRWSVR